MIWTTAEPSCERFGHAHHKTRDQRTGDVQAAGHDVLAERAVPDVPAQLAGPPVEVLAGVDVEGLLRATVVGQVSLLVAVEAEPAHPDRARHGALVDRGTPDCTGPFGRDRASRADGDDLSAVHVRRLTDAETQIDPLNPRDGRLSQGRRALGGLLVRYCVES